MMGTEHTCVATSLAADLTKPSGQVSHEAKIKSALKMISSAHIAIVQAEEFQDHLSDFDREMVRHAHEFLSLAKGNLTRMGQ